MSGRARLFAGERDAAKSESAEALMERYNFSLLGKIEELERAAQEIPHLPLEIAKGGTGSSDREQALMSLLGNSVIPRSNLPEPGESIIYQLPPSKLFEGTFSSGSLSISGISGYRLYYIKETDGQCYMLCTNQGSAIAGGTIRATGTGNVRSVTFQGNLNGDTLTFGFCRALVHNASGSHSSAVSCSVSEIWGVF